MKTELIINKLSKIIAVLLVFFSLLACQSVEILDKIVFDYNLLAKININAEQKNINNVYEINYVDPYIDHSIKLPPILRVTDWLDQNIYVFGSQNILSINIIEASLTKIERKNESKKKYAEKTEFFYEMIYILEFVLYNDSDLILATTMVEAKRSTTSSKFISLNEKEQIIDTLILDTLIDLSTQTEQLLKIYISDYIL